MPTKSLVRLFCLTIAGSFAGGAVASPPPPPPPFIDEIARHIVPTPTATSFSRYAQTIADDLKVWVDGKQIAATKGDWLAIERHRLDKVDRSVLGYVEGYDTILVFDRFDDRSDLPSLRGAVFDPRYKTRAVQYQIGADHLIHAIRIVQADGFVRQLP